ncbi:hypothetical protein [Homoserinimonas sp. OAct 916]|uniref:hypothetical protein n=1 Tax=Homoserinimonas sp. OAct 916 TaxID=2211450 RepID=UPI000DBE0BA0|nr:hypothetical protein [Homoserinimonas sp. OAct 916]
MSRTSDVPGADDFSRLEDRLLAQVASDAAARRRSLRLVAIASAGVLVLAGAGVVWAVTPTPSSTIAGPTAPSTVPSTTPPGAADEEPGSDNYRSAFGTADALEVLPGETLTDWVTYLDRVVSAKVTTISRGELAPEEVEAGEGLEIRNVTLQITDTLWKSEQAHDIGETVTIASGGWLVGQNLDDRRLILTGAVQLEMDHSYLLPLFYDESFDPAWQGLSNTAILPFDYGVIGQGEVFAGERGHAARSTEATRALWGLDRAAVVNTLAATKPNPAAAEYAHLPPVQRYWAVDE